MVVEASGTGAWVGGREVLRRVDLRVECGECVALVGANGAGKTTLLRVLATLLRAEGGSVRLFGEDVRRGAGRARARLGLIAHEPMLYAGLTVRENLELFADLHGLGDARRRATDALGVVGLEDRAMARAGALSRGESQRAAIARAILHEPELVLADEPWTGLDAGAVGVFDRQLAQWQSEGRTVVVATHDLERAVRLTERAVGLRDGRLVLDQASEGLDPAGLGAELGLAGCVA